MRKDEQYKSPWGRYKDRGEEAKEMTKVKCSKCGDDCEVPFKPDGQRPVYCQECYKKIYIPKFIPKFIPR